MKWLSNLRQGAPEESEAPANVEKSDRHPASLDAAGASSGEAPPDPGPADPSMVSSEEPRSAECARAPVSSEIPAGDALQASSVPGTASLDIRADLIALLEAMRAEFRGGQQQLQGDQKALNELFATRLRSDEAQGRAVERMHDELRQYKTNFVRQQFVPLLKEVIFCHDFLTGQIEHLGSGSDAAARPLVAARQMLTDLLFKYDVEPYRSETDGFDPKQQQCTQTIPTDRKEADKAIAARGLEGFRSANDIVRREQVTVYKYTPGAE